VSKYQIIYADPPWSYRTWNAKGGHKSASAHYNTMDINAICALPIQDLADGDCALFLWATFPNLPEAFQVIEAWGFEYKTVAFTWVKTNSNTWGYYMGLGYWTRANAEICLLATKGNPRRISKSVEQLTISPRMEHSHKPAIIREKIVQLLGDLPRVELFARRKVGGWDCWGNEVESDIQLQAIGV